MEVLIEHLELAALRPVTTSGVAEAVDKSQEGATIIDDDPDSVPLVGQAATRYKALAARCKYIAVDRADSQYCTQERSRDMSSPTAASWKKSVRLGRYFFGKIARGYPLQSAVGGHLL